jgi:Na+/H+-dicarboxylate symporter
MPPDVNWDMILTIQVLEEVMQVFMKFITWIIKCTPYAIISLIAAAIGGQTNLGEIFAQLGVLFAAVCVGLLMQFFLVYCGFYLGFVRKNPFKYYKHTVPAMMVSFATSSSAATIPVSIDCAVSSGEVPVGVARFVIPLGATINMDGSAIYIICGSVWMAYQNVRLLLLASEESPL